MTDFERRLRAAMAASAEPAPPGLLDGIHRRHRRHVRRVATACVTAAAVAVAGTLVTRGVLAAGPEGRGPGGTGPAATGPAVGPAAVPSSTATTAPGTVLRDCQSTNDGTVSRDWKAHSVHAGPVWFIYARPGRAPTPSRGPAAGKVHTSAMIIAVSNGRTAVVTPPPGLAGRFRFLASISAGETSSLAEGAPGLTLGGCPASPAGTHIPASYAPGLTMFWQGYVTDLRGCIPLEVRSSPAGPPVRVTVAPAGGCRS